MDVDLDSKRRIKDASKLLGPNMKRQSCHQLTLETLQRTRQESENEDYRMGENMHNLYI